LEKEIMAKKINMTAQVELASANTVDENAVLNDLMAELGVETVEESIASAHAVIEPDEIVEESAIEVEVEAAVAPEAEAAEPVVEAADAADEAAVEAEAHDDAVLEEVAAAAELVEATQAAYAEAGAADEAVSDADKPADESVAGADKGKSKGKPKSAPVAPMTKSQKLVAKLGDKAGEFLLLEISDAELEEAELKARQEQILASIDATAIKVGDKARQLFGWLKNGGTLNEVMRRAFVEMAKDGYLTSGKQGNLHATLLAKPYSGPTAASQGNQIFMLFPALKIAIKEKGKLIPNPDSLLLAKVNSVLGL
jgi:hypothetical protein